MTDQPRLLDAHRRVKEASGVAGSGVYPPAPGTLPAPDELPWTTSAGVLALAGWESKVRLGRWVWRDPNDPFNAWVGEQHAYSIVERGGS